MGIGKQCKRRGRKKIKTGLGEMKAKRGVGGGLKGVEKRKPKWDPAQALAALHSLEYGCSLRWVI